MWPTGRMGVGSGDIKIIHAYAFARLGHGHIRILSIGEEMQGVGLSGLYRRAPIRPNSDVSHQSQNKHLHARHQSNLIIRT